jgi:hypothetical protein
MLRNVIARRARREVYRPLGCPNSRFGHRLLPATQETLPSRFSPDVFYE